MRDWTDARDQASRLLPQAIDAVTEYTDEMETIQPPGDARAYHDAAIASSRSFVDLSEETLAAYQSATGPADLTALRERLEPTGAALRAEFQSIERETDPTVLDALRSIERCGAVSNRLAAF